MAAESPATPPSSPPSACGPNYLVLADPADNGSDVLVLVYKLRAQGVTNLFVVTTEPNKGKVALGIYRSQAEAQARVDELSALGFNVSSEEQPPADGC